AGGHQAARRRRHRQRRVSLPLNPFDRAVFVGWVEPPQGAKPISSSSSRSHGAMGFASLNPSYTADHRGSGRYLDFPARRSVTPPSTPLPLVCVMVMSPALAGLLWRSSTLTWP